MSDFQKMKACEQRPRNRKRISAVAKVFESFSKLTEEDQLEFLDLIKSSRGRITVDATNSAANKENLVPNQRGIVQAVGKNELFNLRLSLGEVVTKLAELKQREKKIRNDIKKSQKRFTDQCSSASVAPDQTITISDALFNFPKFKLDSESALSSSICRTKKFMWVMAHQNIGFDKDSRNHRLSEKRDACLIPFGESDSHKLLQNASTLYDGERKRKHEEASDSCTYSTSPSVSNRNDFRLDQFSKLKSKYESTLSEYGLELSDVKSPNSLECIDASAIVKMVLSDVREIEKKLPIKSQLFSIWSELFSVLSTDMQLVLESVGIDAVYGILLCQLAMHTLRICALSDHEEEEDCSFQGQQSIKKKRKVDSDRISIPSGVSPVRQEEVRPKTNKTVTLDFLPPVAPIAVIDLCDESGSCQGNSPPVVDECYMNQLDNDLYEELHSDVDEESATSTTKESCSTLATVDFLMAAEEPEWDNLGILELHKIAANYGLKCDTRGKMIPLLSAMWKRLHPAVSTTEFSFGDTPHYAISNSSLAIKDLDLPQLKQFILLNQSIYDKVLCFEPIDLDDLYNSLIFRGFKIKKPDLLKLLDGLNIFVSYGKRNDKKIKQ